MFKKSFSPVQGFCAVGYTIYGRELIYRLFFCQVVLPGFVAALLEILQNRERESFSDFGVKVCQYTLIIGLCNFLVLAFIFRSLSGAAYTAMGISFTWESLVSAFLLAPAIPLIKKWCVNSRKISIHIDRDTSVPPPSMRLPLCYSALLLFTFVPLLFMKWSLSFFSTIQKAPAHSLLISLKWDLRLFAIFFGQCLFLPLLIIATFLILRNLLQGLSLSISIFERKPYFFSLQRLGSIVINLTLFVLSMISLEVVLSSVDGVGINHQKDIGAISVFVPQGLAFPTINLTDVFTLAIIIIVPIAITLYLLSVQFYAIGQMDYAKKLPSKLMRYACSAISYSLVFLAFLIHFAAQWVMDTFGNITADKFFFHLQVPLKGTNSDFIISFIFCCLLPSILLTLIVFFTIWPLKPRENTNISLLTKQKKITVNLLQRSIYTACSIIVPLFFVYSEFISFDKSLGLVAYIKSTFTDGAFIDINYVDPKVTKLVFPEEKRNLIYIFMESMENTYMSKELGGTQPINLIPELTDIAADNVSFSNTDRFGGAVAVPGTGWTIGAMVAQHGGLPLKMPVDDNTFGEYGTFLPGASNLGDILAKEGYNQTLLVGSDASFGGRDAYYKQHGNYKILDLFSAWEEDIVRNGRSVWWGFEDFTLYEYAQQELLLLADGNKPFNLTMLTVDTHHVGGYKCPKCGSSYKDQYWDVIACASSQLNDFILWLQEQSFYENTTIVISGDHLSMDKIVSKQAGSSYTQTVYNAFINSAVQPSNTHNRLFSTMDMFPTTLSSMGITIDGNRLSLGTDLFSDTPTLLERYGVDAVSKGLGASSRLYNSLMYEADSK